MKYINVIFLFSLAIAIFIPVVSATVNTSVDTNVIDSTYLDVDIWMLLTVCGWVLFAVSQLTTRQTGNAIWASLCPFFTFASAWFSVFLQRTHVEIFYDSTTGVYNVLSEHFIFHLDWIAVGLFGIIFIFSAINWMHIIFAKREGTKEVASREDIYGPDGQPKF
jgi:hypothetical protein